MSKIAIGCIYDLSRASSFTFGFLDFNNMRATKSFIAQLEKLEAMHSDEGNTFRPIGIVYAYSPTRKLRRIKKKE